MAATGRELVSAHAMTGETFSGETAAAETAVATKAMTAARIGRQDDDGHQASANPTAKTNVRAQLFCAENVCIDLIVL